jgi:hypothetical protein
VIDYYGRDGLPITQEQWVASFGDRGSKRVAFDEVVLDGVQLDVSTVWLGLDHAFRFDGRPHVPLIFETMVFSGSEVFEDFCWRYSSEEEARRGHERVVTLLREMRLGELRGEAE